MILIVGGFERSGHDALTHALAEEASSRGHETTVWTWRDYLDLQNLVLFDLHRLGVQTGLPTLVEATSNPKFLQALISELSPLLEETMRHAATVISTHPWSSLIAANLTETRPLNILDCHSDFTPYPVFADFRISHYLGSAQPKPLPPQLARRQHATGLPVRRSFRRTRHEQPESLAVNFGSNAWFIAPMIQSIEKCVSVLGVKAVHLLINNQDDSIAEDLRKRIRADIFVHRDLTDISGVLLKSEYFLTKAGGAPVAEGIVAGCKLMLCKSGVPWEDLSLSFLVATGEAVEVNAEDSDEVLRARVNLLPKTTGLRQSCATAAASIIDLAEIPPSAETSSHSNLRTGWPTLLQSRLSADLESGVLPRSTAALADALKAWKSETEEPKFREKQ